MNHPKREEWIPYLYGEAKPNVRRELKAHLNSCPECRAELAGWRNSMSRLDAWEMPRPRQQGFPALPILKWAAVTTLLLALGFTLGTLSASRLDMQRTRAALEPQLRRELQLQLTQIIHEEVSKAAAATLVQAGQQTSKAITACAATLEAKRSQDQQDAHAALLLLKQQLDTVAMNTDAGFRQAEQELVQLADFKQPQSSPAQP